MASFGNQLSTSLSLFIREEILEPFCKPPRREPLGRLEASHLAPKTSPGHTHFIMIRAAVLAATIGLAGVVQAQCPFASVGNLAARAEGLSRDQLSEFELDDSEGFMTSDVGGPIGDQEVLTAGERGPTLLEDFIFRQKITHFDHERVCSVGTVPAASWIADLDGTGPRESCARSWCRCSWYFHKLWRLFQHNCGLIPRGGGQEDASLYSLLHRCWLQGKRRHGARCARLRY